MPKLDVRTANIALGVVLVKSVYVPLLCCIGHSSKGNIAYHAIVCH